MMKTMKSKILPIFLTIVIVLLLIPCSKAGAKTLKVGIVLPLSGPVAKWGVSFRNGAVLLAEMINAKGGLNIGKDKYLIELPEQDDKFTAEGAATAARSLIERDKVNLIYGGIGTHLVLAIAQVAEPAHIITLHCAGANEAIAKAKGNRYTFRGYICYNETYPGLLGWVAKTHPQAKSIALLGLNYESSWFGHELIGKLAPGLGMSVVYNEYYEGGTKDFTPFLVKALAAKPNIMFNTSSPTPDWALIMKQARQLGFEGLFMESHPPSLSELTPIAGKEVVEGIIGVGDATSGPMATQGTKDFVQAYIKKHGTWDAEAIVLAPSLHAIFQAMEQAGSLASDKVVAILESGKQWKTILGIVGKFGGTRIYGQPHQWLAPQYVLVVKSGEDVAVSEIPVTEME
ncbi:MAG: ABC transporter substrate-binding protein [Thermodesulfobacteriota bacterium]|jgi:branched-chain amino acid transport system substrate-binding protein